MILWSYGGRIVPRAINLILTKEICTLTLHLAFKTTDGCFCTLAGTGSESSHLSGAPGSSSTSNALWFLVRLQEGADTLRVLSTNQSKKSSHHLWINITHTHPVLCLFPCMPLKSVAPPQGGWPQVNLLSPPSKNSNMAFFIFTISRTPPWANQLSDEFAYGSISPSGRLSTSLSESFSQPSKRAVLRARPSAQTICQTN